ncbi:hypothetical protein [Nocardioides sp.]|uniref:hypothetical protein n=1 Tax=Nocardioides sp. TaxID=35761 RepID=UPI0031FF23F1|nr:hypothetical protein [Nocardioides sp.]
MKFARRRDAPTTEARDPLEAPEDPGPPPPPKPPRGAPVAAYAGIVDGQTLWLAVEAVAGSLAMRASESGDVLAVRSDLAEDQPAYRSIRVDLGELIGDGPASYDLVLVPPGGGAPKTVWSPPLPEGEPLRIPPARDGRTQFALHRSDDGFLRVRRRILAPATELRDVRLHDAGVELTVDPVTDGQPTLLLLEQESPEVVATWPLDLTDAGWAALLTLDRLPPGSGQTLRVGVGTAERWVPVRRRRNDLADPNRAVLLPPLSGDDTDRPALRLRWSRDGLLQARLPQPALSAPEAEDDA